MHRLALFFLVFWIASAAFGQVPTSGGMIVPLPLPPVPLPIFSGFSSSVVDSSGNVLIFDNSFAVPTGVMTPTFSSKTHITVISSDGKTVNGYDYSGAFQIVGVGHNAVYALVNTFGTATTSQIPTINRQLFALRVVAGTLPASLPSLDAPMNEDVKLSPGTGIDGTDTIAFVSHVLPLMMNASPIATSVHQVLLFTCDGAKFFPNPNNPILTHS
jgi:hypothetical protein